MGWGRRMRAVRRWAADLGDHSSVESGERLLGLARCSTERNLLSIKEIKEKLSSVSSLGSSDESGGVNMV